MSSMNDTTPPAGNQASDIAMFKDIPAVVYYSVYTPVFLVGAMGNALLIFIIACHRKMRTAPNRYICNLAVSSLMAIAISVLYPVLDNDKVVPGDVCKLIQLLRRTCLIVNVLTLIVLTVERYHCICYPLLKEFATPATYIITLVITFIWCFSVSLAANSLDVKQMCSRSGTWFYSKALEEKASIFSFFFMYVIPVLVITFLYILIVKELNRALPSVHNHMHEKTRRKIRARKQVAWVVLALVVVFVITNLPFYAITLTYYNRVNPYEEMTVILLSLTNIQACATPVVLYGFSEPCRKYIKYYLLKCCFKSLAPPLEGVEDLRGLVIAAPTSI